MLDNSPSRSGTPGHAAIKPFPLPAPYVSFTELHGKIAEIGLADDALIKQSLEQARSSHLHQRRDNGGPYLEEHIYPVTLSVIEHEIAAGHRVSAKLVSTAVNHDVPEDDKNMPLAEFRKVFGSSRTHTLKPGRSVADLVDPLTKRRPDEFEGATEDERRIHRDESYYKNLWAAEYETRIVKLADRYMNICSLHLCPPEKIIRKIRETEEHYLPFAEKTSAIYFGLISDRIAVLKEWLVSG